jgi:hypothetical protein
LINLNGSVAVFLAVDYFLCIFPVQGWQNAILSRKIRSTYWLNNIKEKTASSSILLLSCSKGSKYQLTCWLRNLWYPQIYWHFETTAHTCLMAFWLGTKKCQSV